MGEAKPTAQPQLNKHRFSEWRKHCEWSHVVFLWDKIQLSVDSHIKRKQQIYTHLILSAPSPDVDLHSCLPVCLNIFQDDFTTCKPETSYNVSQGPWRANTHTHTTTDVPPPILISCECMCVSPSLFTSTSLNALAVCGREGFWSLWPLREEGGLCFSAFCLQGRRRRRWSNMTWCVPFFGGGGDPDTPTRCLHYSLLFLLPLSWEQEEEKGRTQREAKGALKCKIKLRKAKGSLFVFSLSTCNIHQSATTLKTLTGEVSNTIMSSR